MGKEWPLGGRSSSRRARDANVDRHRHHRPSLPGCMSTLFHLFDFHSSSLTPSDLLKASHHGVEAPRNSLELDEASISCLRNKNENLQIQMGLQIKTRKNGSKKSKASEQKHQNIYHIASDSPSAKTPNLLARLMGLDNLPQTTSPSSSFRRQPKSGACYHVSGTRSLPESPRVSSSRLSDVDHHHHHHRLSLQISSNKKNIEICEEIKREEKVRRKVALVDITNNNKKLEYGKQDVGFDRSKKVEKSSSKRHKKTVVDEFSTKIKNQEVMMCRKQKPISMSTSRPKQKAKARKKEEAREEDEASNNLLNNLSHPTKFSVKKEPSPFVAQVPHEQTYCSYPKGKQKPPAPDGGERNGVDSSAATDGGASELKYIKRILMSHGISMNTPISSPNWLFPTNSLNPSIVHSLETTATAAVEDPTRHRWKRRLLFHLVDEVLGEIIKKKGSWHVRMRSPMKMKGWELARAKCEILEDIDSLIDKDLGKWNMLETEGIVRVIEFHILDSLLRETIAAIVSVHKGCRFVGMGFTSRESAT